MGDKTGRHELKHYINHADLFQLRARLPCVAKLDKNAADSGGYRVRSLYFDNYEDKALREKVEGINDREKFRLRFYNDDPTFIRLEKKSKKGRISFKRSTGISLEVCRQILSGNFGALKESGDPLHMELYAKMHYHLLRPKTIVDYRREAFIYPPGNVRITLDSDIRTSFSPQSFLQPVYVSVPIPKANILEVKYDEYLPELIRGIVALSGRRSTAFSKYAATRII